MMVIGLLVPIVIVVLVVLAIRKSSGRDGAGPADEHTVRRFFQYLLLYGLLVVVGSGVSGLLGRALEQGFVLAADDVALAQDLAFTVVGVPLLAGVGYWVRRTFTRSPDERRAVGWAVYVGGAALTSLAMAMTALGGILQWVTGLEAYDGTAVARFLVWTGIWAAHWWLDGRVTPGPYSHVHHVAGSLVGLVTSAVGLVLLVSGTVRVFLGLDAADAVLAGGGSTVQQGIVVFVVGAPAWFVYWVRTTAREQRDPLWLAYVLLAGVGGGLVTALSAASTLVYSLLVWWVGDPRTDDALEHFDGAPTAAATTVVGILAWWYHQAVLAEAGPGSRTEVRRIYEYLMAGIALVAAAGGVATALVAVIEALTGNAGLVVDDRPVNTLLAALTLLAVGGPVWWFFWHRIHTAGRSAVTEDLTSPTRRVYLFVLFGVGGVVAVVALLIGVYQFFEDVVEGTLGAETLRVMRFAIGVLLTTAAISAYHWVVYRADREQVPAAVAARGPGFVLLVGPTDGEIAHAVARRTHGRVQAWSRADDGTRSWSLDEVMAALDGITADEIIVLSEADGVRAIPVHRRG